MVVASIESVTDYLVGDLGMYPEKCKELLSVHKELLNSCIVKAVFSEEAGKHIMGAEKERLGITDEYEELPDEYWDDDFEFGEDSDYDDEDDEDYEDDFDYD